jgi:hypothetical protein
MTDVNFPQGEAEEAAENVPDVSLLSHGTFACAQVVALGPRAQPRVAGPTRQRYSCIAP